MCILTSLEELPPKRERLELRELADEVIETAVIKASSRIRIFNRVKPGVVVDADREHLIRVLTNLKRNAIQALEFLQAERSDAPEGVITLEARREGSVTVIEIRDNGPGVPAQIRESLFQPFVTSKANGAGLGLALVAKLVAGHGGLIDFESEPGRTVFRVLLPIATHDDNSLDVPE